MSCANHLQRQLQCSMLNINSLRVFKRSPAPEINYHLPSHYCCAIGQDDEELDGCIEDYHGELSLCTRDANIDVVYGSI